jgi:oligosaccharide repeat unit polymerase
MNSFKIKKKSLKSFFGFLFYKTSLDVSYFTMASWIGDYMRLYEMDFNPFKFAESYLLLLIIYILVPKSKNGISGLLIWLIVLISYVPMLTLYSFMDKPRSYMYAVTGFWFVVVAIMRFLPRVKPLILERRQASVFRWLVYASLIVVIAGFIVSMKFSLNLDLAKVYQVRGAYEALGARWFDYLLASVAYVINPVFFIYFFKKKQWLLFIASAVFQLLMAVAFGNKTYLFVLPFALFLIFVMHRKNPLFWLSIGFSVPVLAGTISYYLFKDLWVYMLFARRMLLVPSQLSFIYYDFFSNHEFTYLSGHKIFSFITEYPYNDPPARLIGQSVLNSLGNSANNGIYADAYLNFGMWGFIIWGVALAIILVVLEWASSKKDKDLGIAAVGLLPIVFSNSALLTAILSNGILVAIVFLVLLPRDRESQGVAEPPGVE